MSVCRKLADGTVQKIAGHTILLDANAAEIRQGTGHLTKRPNAQFMDSDVTFSDPMPDTDYAVDISFVTAQGISALARVQQKTVTGFKLEGYVCNETDASVYGDNGWDFKYIAWKPIKLDGYTALQNKVNNPDASPTEDSLNLVTSGGVYEAIKNASAVWKGTKAAWEALPAADKMKYDLAVLIDETLVKAVDREDGTETDVANLNKIVPMTQAEYDAMSSHDPDTYYMITDDTTVMSPGYPRPDWANAVSITAAQLNTGYAAPSDGMFVGSITIINGTVSITVNNIKVAGAESGASSYYDSCSIQCPVAAGDIIKDISTGTSRNVSISFVPWK